ncbi:unnamed protein product [Pylaiella littoralis]
MRLSKKTCIFCTDAVVRSAHTRVDDFWHSSFLLRRLHVYGRQNEMFTIYAQQPNPSVKSSYHQPIPRTHTDVHVPGAKHANKAKGPMKWLEEEIPDGFTYEPFYEADAHAIDLPESIHQGVRPPDLERGSVGVIEYFERELKTKWLKEPELLLVSYDRAALVPVIKGHEQQGRTDKIGGSDRTFGSSSEDPISPSQFQARLRADGKKARDGVATHLAMKVLADPIWSGDDAPTKAVEFYGVGDEPGMGWEEEVGIAAGGVSIVMVGRDSGVSSAGAAAYADGEMRESSAPMPGAGSGSAGTKDDTSGESGLGPRVIKEPLLHFRNGTAGDMGIHRHREPDIGEAELSIVHFIVWDKKYWGNKFRRWLVTSVDTDEWMIIQLAMSTGKIAARGPEAVQVTCREPWAMFPGSCWSTGRSPKLANSRTAVSRRGLRLTSSLGDPMMTTRSACSYWSTSCQAATSCRPCLVCPSRKCRWPP